MPHGRTSRGVFVRCLTTLLVGGLLVVPRESGAEIEGALAFSSDYVLHGLTHSRGNPVVQGQIGWADERGWSAGAWFSRVDYNDGPDMSRELDFYLSRRWTLSGDLALLTELTQYTFDEPSTIPSYDYTELRLGLSFRERVELSASVSPDYTAISYAGPAHNETVVTYGATTLFPITHRLSLNAGVGRFDMQRPYGRTYTYWNAGGELQVGRLDLALSYIGTDSVATELFGDYRAGDRVVATLALRLP